MYKQNETSYEVSLCLRSLNFWLMVYLIDISSINTHLDWYHNKENEENEVNELIEKVTEDKEKTKIELDADKEKLEEYKPSIKDFNIKSARTRKYVKKGMLYVIIVMLLGFEFFINKTGDALNDLVVYASDNEPIKIEQNAKYG